MPSRRCCSSPTAPPISRYPGRFSNIPMVPDAAIPTVAMAGVIPTTTSVAAAALAATNPTKPPTTPNGVRVSAKSRFRLFRATTDSPPCFVLRRFEPGSAGPPASSLPMQPQWRPAVKGRAAHGVDRHEPCSSRTPTSGGFGGSHAAHTMCAPMWSKSADSRSWSPSPKGTRDSDLFSGSGSLALGAAHRPRPIEVCRSQGTEKRRRRRMEDGTGPLITFSLAGVPGLEPRTTVPETAVLPITPYPKAGSEPRAEKQV